MLKLRHSPCVSVGVRALVYVLAMCCTHVTGDALVSVSTCGSEQYGQCDLTSMKLSEFINCLEEQSSEAPASNGVMLYLKDWHICRYVHMYLFTTAAPNV